MERTDERVPLQPMGLSPNLVEVRQQRRRMNLARRGEMALADNVVRIPTDSAH